MSGPFKENWKRLSNRFRPNTEPTAMDPKDILRFEDAGLFGGGPITVTVKSSGTVTISNDSYLIVASGATTINMPIAPSDGERHIIKDSLGTAGTTPVTISGNGFLIDGAATAILNNNYQAMEFIFSSVLGRWQIG